MINKEGRRVVEPGRFTVFVGGRQPGYRSPNDAGFTGLVSDDIIIE